MTKVHVPGEKAATPVVFVLGVPLLARFHKGQPDLAKLGEVGGTGNKVAFLLLLPRRGLMTKVHRSGSLLQHLISNCGYISLPPPPLSMKRFFVVSNIVT